MIHWRSIPISVIIFCSFILGGLVVWFGQDLNLPFFQRNNIFRGSILRLEDSGYSLVDPLLTCDAGPEEAFPEIKHIKDELKDLIEKEVDKGRANRISLYVRSLKAGRWFEINGDTTYAPASLLKVSIMIAYYREAEDEPAILQRQIVFKGSANPESDMLGEVIPHLTDGEKYTVSQLIDQMIVYSDNDATENLLNSFDPKTTLFLKEIFTDLNIPSPFTRDENQLNFMSVTSFATMFRVLFSTTYLNRSDSEKALELLSRTHYKGGIVAGVPANLTVAHKFGIREELDNSGKTAVAELHDCGIVYYPNHPYLLCVMTRGLDFSLLQKIIQDISAANYQGFDKFFSQSAK